MKILALLLALPLAFPAGVPAQDAGVGDRPDPGVVESFERVLIETIRADSVRRWARGLAARSHVAGTRAQRTTRDSVVAWMRSAGLTAGHDSLVLYLPHPLELALRQTGPVTREFALREPPLGGRAYEHVPTFNAFSGRGTAKGLVVYANFGLPDDYARLEELGIDVRGRIVVARYGRSFRGIKSREAERRGAAGLLLYSDPAADGFARGPVLPEGPYRPPRGVQRGSILNSRGDPSTPGRPSTPGSARIPEPAMEGIARIPVLPIGYETARELLASLGGPPAPPGWTGALDVPYRPGPGPAEVEMTVRTESGDAAYRPAFNTVAVLPGEIWPEEWVLIGAHRDSWGPGAVDNVSGTAVVVEAARAFGAAHAAGHRPARSLLFATWDAEEWGIIGSTEWMEANRAMLDARAVAYINQDSPVSGPNFSAAAAPEIRSVVRDATRAVPAPATDGSVYSAWLERQRRGAEDDIEQPAVGTMGGGSDHLPFYIHLGIPSAGFGFGGGQGVYHSMYDTREWMERFGDPGYPRHVAAARLSVVILSRLANSPLLPYDHEELARAFRTELAGFAAELDLDAAVESAGRASALDTLRAAADAYQSSAGSFADASRAIGADAAVAGARPPVDLLAKVNAAQRDALRQLLAPPEEGRWERNLYVRDDPDNGYSPLLLPGLRLALRHADAGAIDREARLLAARFIVAAARLDDATALLVGE